MPCACSSAMDNATVGGGERSLESGSAETLDRAAHRGRDLFPAIGAMAPDRAGGERIETEADIASRGIDALGLHIFRDMDRRHPRLRTNLKLDADAGVEVDVLEDSGDDVR